LSFIQNLFTSRDNNANSATYVGQQDRLWWDPVTNQFYYSDGETPGGFPVGSGGNVVTNKLVNGAYELVLDASGNVTAPGAVSTVGNVTANYFVGNGSQLTGINVSTNKIFNGNSYANVASADGNVEISANGQYWNFATDGNLTLPGNTSKIYGSANNFAVYTNPASTSGLEISTDTETNLFNQNIVNIITNVGTSNKRWEFGTDGNLTLPGNSVSINYANGTPYGGSGTGLPPQTGNVGKILSTNGTTPLWETMPGVFGLVIDGGDAAFASLDFIVDGGEAA
jgi:hypothetical protein